MKKFLKIISLILIQAVFITNIALSAQFDFENQDTLSPKLSLGTIDLTFLFVLNKASIQRPNFQSQPQKAPRISSEDLTNLVERLKKAFTAVTITGMLSTGAIASFVMPSNAPIKDIPMYCEILEKEIESVMDLDQEDIWILLQEVQDIDAIKWVTGIGLEKKQVQAKLLLKRVDDRDVLSFRKGQIVLVFGELMFFVGLPFALALSTLNTLVDRRGTSLRRKDQDMFDDPFSNRDEKYFSQGREALLRVIANKFIEIEVVESKNELALVFKELQSDFGKNYFEYQLIEKIYHSLEKLERSDVLRGFRQIAKNVSLKIAIRWLAFAEVPIRSSVRENWVNPDLSQEKLKAILEQNKKELRECMKAMKDLREVMFSAFYSENKDYFFEIERDFWDVWCQAWALRDNSKTIALLLQEKEKKKIKSKIIKAGSTPAAFAEKKLEGIPDFKIFKEKIADIVFDLQKSKLKWTAGEIAQVKELIRLLSTRYILKKNEEVMVIVDEVMRQKAEGRSLSEISDDKALINKVNQALAEQGMDWILKEKQGGIQILPKVQDSLEDSLKTLDIIAKDKRYKRKKSKPKNLILNKKTAALLQTSI